MIKKIMIIVLSVFLTGSLANAWVSWETYDSTAGVFFDENGYDYIQKYPHLLAGNQMSARYHLSGLVDCLSYLSNFDDLNQNTLASKFGFVSPYFMDMFNFGLSVDLNKSNDPNDVYKKTNTIGYDPDDDGIYEQIDKSVYEYGREYEDGNSTLDFGLGCKINESFSLGLSYEMYGLDHNYTRNWTEEFTQRNADGFLGYSSTLNDETRTQSPDKKQSFILSALLALGEQLQIHPQLGYEINAWQEIREREYRRLTDHDPESTSNGGLYGQANTDEQIGYNMVNSIIFNYPYYLSSSYWERADGTEDLNMFFICPEAHYRINDSCLFKLMPFYRSGTGTINNAKQDYYKDETKRPNTADSFTETRTEERLLNYTETGDNTLTNYGARLDTIFDITPNILIGLGLSWQVSNQEKDMSTQADYTRLLTYDNGDGSTFNGFDTLGGFAGEEGTQTIREDKEVEITKTSYENTISLPIGVQAKILDNLTLRCGMRRIHQAIAGKVVFKTVSDAQTDTSLDYADPAVDDEQIVSTNTEDAMDDDEEYVYISESQWTDYSFGFGYEPWENILIDFYWQLSYWSMNSSLTLTYRF